MYMIKMAHIVQCHEFILYLKK